MHKTQLLKPSDVVSSVNIMYHAVPHKELYHGFHHTKMIPGPFILHLASHLPSHDINKTDAHPQERMTSDSTSDVSHINPHHILMMGLA